MDEDKETQGCWQEGQAAWIDNDGKREAGAGL